MQSSSSAAQDKLVGQLRALSARLPDAEQYVMVHHPAFRVGKKPFAIAGLNRDEQGATLSVNLGRDMQHQLLDDERFSRTPYIGQHGWVSIAHAQLKKGELDMLVTESFRRIANKKQRAALDGPPRETKPSAERAAAARTASPKKTATKKAAKTKPSTKKPRS